MVLQQVTAAYTIVGEDMDMFGEPLTAVPEDFEFAKNFGTLSMELIASGNVTVHPVEVNKGGLEGVFDGLQRLREGRVHGKKLVYRIDETP